jgi:hypothetical protein
MAEEPKEAVDRMAEDTRTLGEGLEAELKEDLDKAKSDGTPNVPGGRSGRALMDLANSRIEPQPVASQTDAVLGLQEQSAVLRHLTRLITQPAELDVFFDEGVSEVARSVDASAWLARHDPGGSTTVVASNGEPAHPSVTSAVVVDGMTWGSARIAGAPAARTRRRCLRTWRARVDRRRGRALRRQPASRRPETRRDARCRGSVADDLFAAVARAVAHAIDVDAIQSSESMPIG